MCTISSYSSIILSSLSETNTTGYWPRWLDVEEPGVMVPILRSPENMLVLVAGDPARSRSAYCPARPYNRPVTKKVRLP